MPTTAARTRVTARELFKALAPFGPAVEGEDLAFDAGPLPDLDVALRVLHTGIRALLTGRKWFGCDASTGRVVELNPAAPIPADVGLVAVEGDRRWDRIRAGSRDSSAGS